MINERYSRNLIIAKARAKYIPGKTQNISEAVRVFLQNDIGELEKRVPVIITSRSRPKNWVDLIGRPKCPDCQREMGLRIIRRPKGKANRFGWNTCWECLRCGYEEYSLKTIEEWREPRHKTGEKET